MLKEQLYMKELQEKHASFIQRNVNVHATVALSGIGFDKHNSK